VRVTDSTGAIGQTSVLIGEPFDPPGNLTARLDPGGESATVEWTPPADTGGSPLSEYVLVTDPPTSTQTVPPDATSTSVHGLSIGTTYTISVYARNIGGAQSQPASATVPPPPSSWPSFRHDLTNSGYNPDETTLGPGDVGGLLLVRRLSMNFTV